LPILTLISLSLYRILEVVTAYGTIMGNTCSSDVPVVLASAGRAASLAGTAPKLTEEPHAGDDGGTLVVTICSIAY
jgi:hypothetical protein